MTEAEIKNFLVEWQYLLMAYLESKLSVQSIINSYPWANVSKFFIDAFSTEYLISQFLFILLSLSF